MNDVDTQPSSWRDVYQLVQDVEGRLTARMNDIAKVATTVSSDHELRIRAIEANGWVSSGAHDLSAANAKSIIANQTRIEAIEVATVARRAAAEGRNNVFSYGQKLIVTVVLVTNIVIAIVTLVHR